jgi:signal transduction histidine kinase
MTATHSQTGPRHFSARTRPLSKIFLVTLSGMTIFEVVKTLVHPDITLWESHVVTIVFSGLAAVVGGISALKKYEQLHQQFVDVVAEQSHTEKQLRQVQGELEKRMAERNADLVRANAALQIEVTERKQAEGVARGQTSSLMRTLHLLTSSPSVDAVLAHVLTAITEQLQAFSSVLYRYDLESQHAWIERMYYDGKVWLPGQEGERVPYTPEPTASPEEPAVQRLWRTRSPIVVENVPHSSLLTPDFCRWAEQFGIKSTLLIPLLLEGKLLGSLHVRHREYRRYSTEEITLAVSLAHLAVLALQITRLAEQGQRAAVLAERNRMAREIHDTLSQGLTGIIVQLEAADDVLEESPEETLSVREHLARAGALARESLAEARRSVYDLRPQVLEHESLPAAIAHTVHTMTTGTTVQADFSLVGGYRQLPIEVEEHVLRISQQALTNILQHAQAHAVHVELAFAVQEIRLVIQDDGRGLDYTNKNDHGFGLIGMQQRAEQIGGQLTMASHAGHGTTITVTVPLLQQHSAGSNDDRSGENQSDSHSDRG